MGIFSYFRNQFGSCNIISGRREKRKLETLDSAYHLTSPKSWANPKQPYLEIWSRYDAASLSTVLNSATVSSWKKTHTKKQNTKLVKSHFHVTPQQTKENGKTD